MILSRLTSPIKEEKNLLPIKTQLCRSVGRIGSAIQIVQVDRDAESDPILEKDLDQECNPKKSDRSEAWGAIHQLLSIIHKLKILVLLPLSTMPYVVKVKNYS
jgi:hypothetical protein